MEDQGQQWKMAGFHGTATAEQAANAGYAHMHRAGQTFRASLEPAAQPTYTPSSISVSPSYVSTSPVTSPAYVRPATSTSANSLVSPGPRVPTYDASFQPQRRFEWRNVGLMLLALPFALFLAYFASGHRTVGTTSERSQPRQSTLSPRSKVQAYVVTQELNVRNAPTSRGSAIGKLSCGQVVQTHGGIAKGWTAIDLPDSSGQAYVSSRYLAAAPPIQTYCH
jgi:uncharacterized protein YgiM (DUF1202 family)